MNLYKDDTWSLNSMNSTGIRIYILYRFDGKIWDVHRNYGQNLHGCCRFLKDLQLINKDEFVEILKKEGFNP